MKIKQRRRELKLPNMRPDETGERWCPPRKENQSRQAYQQGLPKCSWEGHHPISEEHPPFLLQRKGLLTKTWYCRQRRINNMCFMVSSNLFDFLQISFHMSQLNESWTISGGFGTRTDPFLCHGYLIWIENSYLVWISKSHILIPPFQHTCKHTKECQQRQISKALFKWGGEMPDKGLASNLKKIFIFYRFHRETTLTVSPALPTVWWINVTNS